MFVHLVVLANQRRARLPIEAAVVAYDCADRHTFPAIGTRLLGLRIGWKGIRFAVVLVRALDRGLRRCRYCGRGAPAPPPRIRSPGPNLPRITTPAVRFLTWHDARRLAALWTWRTGLRLRRRRFAGDAAYSTGHLPRLSLRNRHALAATRAEDCSAHD